MTEFLREHLHRAPAIRRHYPWAMPDKALRFRTAAEVPEVLADSGNNHLTPGLSDHHPRMESALYSDRFFVLAHPADNGSELFTVNWAAREEAGDHIYLYRFDDTFADADAAHEFAEQAFSQVEWATAPVANVARPAMAQQVAPPSVSPAPVLHRTP